MTPFALLSLATTAVDRAVPRAGLPPVQSRTQAEAVAREVLRAVLPKLADEVEGDHYNHPETQVSCGWDAVALRALAHELEAL